LLVHGLRNKLRANEATVDFFAWKTLRLVNKRNCNYHVA